MIYLFNLYILCFDNVYKIDGFVISDLSLCISLGVFGIAYIRDAIDLYVYVFVEADEKLLKRRICAHTKKTKHWFFKRKLEVQRGDVAQMWQMGSSNGTVVGQKVRI